MSFFSTDTNNYRLTILRVTLGVVMLSHGLQKLFGAFDGPGFSGAMSFLTGMGIPAFIAFLVIMGESVGALSLIFGFLTRLCAASIGVIILGAILLVHAKNGFFAGAGGYEFHLLIIAISVVLAWAGGGAWSIDGMIAEKK